MASAMHVCRASYRFSRACAHVAAPSTWAAARPTRCAAAPARQACFSTTTRVRNAAAPAAHDGSAGSPESTTADASASAPPEGGAAASAPKSSCPAGTVLNGLNYIKGRTDPVALHDDEYPAWLWNCLEVIKTTSAEDADAGDEFSKSKKQRRLAAKRQRELEARLAEGDVTALAPKIPLHQQTINLPVTAAEATGGAAAAVLDGQSEPAELADTLAAEAARRQLRVALRKARRAKIKEDNYLRSM